MRGRFSPGDKVVIIDGARERERERIGEVVTITSPLRPLVYQSETHGGISFFYETDITIKGRQGLALSYTYVYRDCDLKPFYDGNEKTSWEDCVFKPKELVDDCPF